LEHWISWFHEQTVGEEVKSVAQAAEALGFSGVALSDHIAIPKNQAARHPEMGQPYDPHLPMIDPFTVAATMGAVTTRLRFMSYALVGGMRDPFSVARQAGSLAGLTGNRFALGTTPGWLTDEIELLGHNPRTRGKRFDEALQVIEGLWKEDLFSFHGEHYNFADVSVCPRPKVPPKILIGGNSPKSYERAKRYDGWIGMSPSLEQITEIAQIVRGTSDDKAIYQVAAQPPSEEYFSALESVGVDGLVHMIWFPGVPTPVEEKCRLMEEFAQRWIEHAT
jgi:probable F420-dependent oxidoreductase